MSEGVMFADGEQVSARTSSSQQGNIGSAGGPLETPTSDKGRSSGVVVGNNESMPQSGSSLVSPMDK